MFWLTRLVHGGTGCGVELSHVPPRPGVLTPRPPVHTWADDLFLIAKSRAEAQETTREVVTALCRKALAVSVGKVKV